MDIFTHLLSTFDVVVSFFGAFSNLQYQHFQAFLQGEYILNFTTFFYNLPCSLTMPSIDIIGVDLVVDMLFDLFSMLFYPISFLANDVVGETPFYVCFFSFMINGLLIFAFIKLVSFIVELIPGE